MRTAIFVSLFLAVATTTVAGCGGSFPPPSERLATAEAAARSARELGADKDPKAALHLKLAQEQIDQAKAQMKAEENKKADQTLSRAGADAELAVALAKENNARSETEKAKEKIKSLKKEGK